MVVYNVVDVRFDDRILFEGCGEHQLVVTLFPQIVYLCPDDCREDEAALQFAEERVVFIKVTMLFNVSG